MNGTRTITSDEDVIDVRDAIERYEALRAAWADANDADPDDFTLTGDDLRLGLDDDEADEMEALTVLLADLKGGGGDHEWQGDWYPVTLIRDSYFEDYARELAEDIGAIPSDYTWPASHIDWDAAATALRMDYFSVEFAGVTYWAR